MGTIATVLAWVAGGIIATYLILAELLDTIGRIEIVEKRWPKVWRAMNNRPIRLALIVFWVALVGKDVAEKIRLGDPPPLHVMIQTPAVPDVQFSPPAMPAVPQVVSLRSRAIKTAIQLEAFLRERGKLSPECIQSATATPAQVKACQDMQAFNAETYKLYSERFSVPVVTLIQEFKAKGMDVSQLENCAPYGFCNPTPLPIAIRAMASRLDAKDDVRR